jgi:hypothetical protein
MRNIALPMNNKLKPEKSSKKSTSEPGSLLPNLPSKETLQELATGLKKQASLVASFIEEVDFQDPSRIEKKLKRLSEHDSVDVSPIQQTFGGWLSAEKATRLSRLESGLRRYCEERGLLLSTVTKEPLELRIAPLAVTIDVGANKGTIRFGGEPITPCQANADSVMAAYDIAYNELEGKSWDPKTFFNQLRKAWLQAGGKDSVELVQVLPLVALARQSDKFRREPITKHFRPYSRAQFAYDLYRLMRDKTLSCDGYRLSLGTATGDSTRDKKRVFFIENDRGRGQYHLTLRFVRDGGAK